MECLFPSGERHYSPVWVSEVRPLKTGAGRLVVSFYHANYPEGVRDKVYELTVLHRAPGFVLSKNQTGEIGQERIVIFEAISGDWLRRHFPALGILANDEATLGRELDRLTGRDPKARR